MTNKAATKQSKPKPLRSPTDSLPGLTPAQSRALRLVRKGSKFTTSDLVDALLDSTDNEIGSFSLARAHVRAWQAAGYITASTQGSQGVAGVYKRVK